MSFYLYPSLSIFFYLYLSLSISIYLHLSLSISVSIYLYLSLSLCISVPNLIKSKLNLNLIKWNQMKSNLVCPSIYLFIYLSIYLSIYLIFIYLVVFCCDLRILPCTHMNLLYCIFCVFCQRDPRGSWSIELTDEWRILHLITMFPMKMAMPWVKSWHQIILLVLYWSYTPWGYRVDIS